MADVPNRYDDEVRNFRADEYASNQRDAEWMAKLAVIAAGTNVLGRASGRNFFADAMDYMGKGARFLGRIGRRADPEFTPETADMLYRHLAIHPDAGGKAFVLGMGGARVASVDNVQDLAEAMRVLQRPELATHRAELADRFARHFQHLPRSTGRATPSVFHHDLQPLTFGEIMERSHDWIENMSTARMPTRTGTGRRIPLSVGVIEEALQQQWIHADTIVDGNLFKHTSSGKIVDMRMTNPKHALQQLSQVVDLAGIVRAASHFARSGRAVSEIAPTENRKLGVFIAGETFELGDGGLMRTGTGMTLGEVADKRFQPARLREAASRGTLHALYDAPPANDTLMGRIQEATGVGTRFADKRGFGIPFFKGILRNIKGVATGDATFYARDYRPTGNPFTRLLAPLMPEADFVGAAGREYAEGKFHGRGFMDKDKVGFLDRVLAYAGLNKDLVVLKSSAKTAAKPSKDHLFTDFRHSGIRSLEQPVGMRTPAEGAAGIDFLGQKEFVERASHYATSESFFARAQDFGNYMTMRLNALASSTGLGIGFRPGGSVAANVGRLAAIPALYMAGAEAIRYGNFAVGELTGVRPIDALATAYTKARVLQQEAREATGIQQGADYAERALFPGLSTGLLGTAASVALGLRTLGRSGSWLSAGVKGGAVYGAVGGPDVAQEADELRAEYAGERKVEIRKARWWMMGYQPFKGGEIDHYAPSWYQKLTKQPGTQNIYGSEKNYFAHQSLLPTPHNLFGLRNVLDPYWTEKRNYYTRPYPVTGGLFEEVPIIGPMLSDTVGEFFKPRKRMHGQQQEAMVANSNIQQRGVPADIASRMGIPQIPNSLVNLNRPDVLKDRTEKWANVALEPAGIWKFALETFGVKFDDGFKMADAGNMSSVSRAFYDMNLGGAFGQTEFIRRFLMADYGAPNKINQQINPIPNAMPRWLPGSLSENADDRSYFVDFTRGDAYTKLSGGEYRLPGKGYEAVNPLHSEMEGVYSDVDRLLILADVAPYSTAFYKAQSAVSGMHLSEYWQSKVQDALVMRERKADRFGFQTSDTISKANLNPLAQGIRTMWDHLDGAMGEIPMLGSKFFPKDDPFEHYVKFQIEGDSFANWQRPMETIVRPAFYDMAGSSPIGGAMKGATLGAILGAPAARFLNPIQPLSRSFGGNVLGGAVLGGSVSGTRMAMTGQLTGGFIPSHVRGEREVKEYFDYLQYAKYTSLAEFSAARGDEENADVMRRQAERTVAYGLSHFRETGDTGPYARSLDRTQRAYFEAFQSAPAAKHDRILQYVPDHMAEVLSGMYGRGGGDRTGLGPRRAALESASEYFEDHTIPGASWAGWHPGVSMAGIKIKSVQTGINGLSDSVHRFGFFPQQEREVEARFGFVPGIESTTDLGFSNAAAKFYDIFGEYLPGGDFMGLDFGVGPDLQVRRHWLHDDRRDDVFSFFQTSYR